MVERAAEKGGVNLRGTMIFTCSIILLAKAMSKAMESRWEGMKSGPDPFPLCRGRGR